MLKYEEKINASACAGDELQLGMRVVRRDGRPEVMLAVRFVQRQEGTLLQCQHRSAVPPHLPERCNWKTLLTRDSPQ